MDLFEAFGEWVAYSLLSITKDTQLGSAASFFFADIVKVFLLLCIAIFLVSTIRTFISPQKVRRLLSKRSEGVGNLFAALLGIPTPFCSCSAVPLFIGFVEAGVPLGVTFSFLISSPMINEVAIALLFALFGWQIAVLYIVFGLAIAVFAGIIIGRLHLEGEVEEFVYTHSITKIKEKKFTWRQRMQFASEETKNIALKVAPYLLFGIALGAGIHGFVPVGFLSDIASSSNPLAVPIAVIIGIPLYSNAAGVLPLVAALMEKGVSLGTALAFMMSVTALSLPEMIILRKVLKPKLIAIFIAIMFISIVAVGLLFNVIIH